MDVGLDSRRPVHKVERVPRYFPHLAKFLVVTNRSSDNVFQYYLNYSKLINSMYYGTQRFNFVFTRAILSRINQIPSIDIYFFRIYSNIVLASGPRPF